MKTRSVYFFGFFSFLMMIAYTNCIGENGVLNISSLAPEGALQAQSINHTKVDFFSESSAAVAGENISIVLHRSVSDPQALNSELNVEIKDQAENSYTANFPEGYENAVISVPVPNGLMGYKSEVVILQVNESSHDKNIDVKSGLQSHHLIKVVHSLSEISPGDVVVK